MKRLNYLFQRSRAAGLAVIAAFIGSVPFTGDAFANTWVDCSGEWGTCTIEDNPSEGATVRYGANGVYVFKYSVNTGAIGCNNSSFGDPTPGAVKRCSYSFDSAPRSTDALALHSLMPAEYNVNDHDEFLAHTLSENERLVSSNGAYRLEMQQDGNLVLRKVTGADQGVKWSTGAFGSTSNGLYRFHVTHKGIEIRKNGAVIWSRYPTAGDNKNYALHISDSGWVGLIDMEDRYSRWFIAFGSDRLRDTEVFDGVLMDIWGKMGWDHTDDWTADEIARLRSLRNDRSHWTLHSAVKGAEKIRVSIDRAEDDLFKEILGVVDSIDLPAGPEAINDIIDVLVYAPPIAEFATGVGKLIEHLEPDDLDFATLFENEIDRVLNEEVLSDEISAMVDSLQETDGALGRRLSNSSSKADCKKLCRFLSRDQNQNKRVDYAFEVAPTILKKTLKEGQFISGSWINQLQLRFFFTHPRVNGDGRLTTDLRVRVLDFAGVTVSAEFKNQIISPEIDPSFGAIVVHDFNFTYSWGKDESYKHHRVHEGTSYISTTGLLLEADLAFTNGDFNFKNGVSDALAGAVGTANVAVNLPAMSPGSIASSSLATSVNASVDDVGTLASASTSSVAEEVSEMAARFTNKVNVTIEFGAGVGAVAQYDLRKMRDIKKLRTGDRGTLGGILTEIMLTQSLGSAAVVFLSTRYGPNAAADTFIDSLKGDLTLVNSELILGGLAGDIAFVGLHHAVNGKTSATKLNGAAFVWAAGRFNPISYLADGMSGKVAEVFGGDGALFVAPRFRFQFNWDWTTPEWIDVGDDSRRLSEYSNLQLLTKHNQCISNSTGSLTIVQENCLNNRQIWQSNRTGSGDVFEFRSMENGACIGIPDTSYDASNTVNNGVATKALACDAVKNRQSVRWKANYIGNNRVVLRSSLDPTKCLDLSAGSPNSGASMQTWDCNISNANQHFTIQHVDGIRDTSTRHTIRMAPDKCIDNQTQSANPANGTAFNIQDCIDQGDNRQDFKFISKGAGFYQIQMFNKNKYLDVSGVSQLNNAIVHTWSGTSGQNQHWQPIVKEDGTVQLRVRHSSQCLELSTSGSTRGKLVQNLCDSTKGVQRFIISSAEFQKFRGYDTNPDKVPFLNFNNYTLSSYGGSAQDKVDTGPVTVGEFGNTLTISGNRWQDIDFGYTVKSNTILEFTFASSREGEIQGIGFDTDDSPSANRMFQLYGRDAWGIRDFTYTGSGAPQTFKIPVGVFFEGSSFNRLVFANDDDNPLGGEFGNATFSNIRIFELTDTGSDGPINFGQRYALFDGPSDKLLTESSNPVDIGAAWTASATFTDLTPNGTWSTLFRGTNGDFQIIVKTSTGELGSYSGGFKGTGYNALILDDGQPHTITAVGSGSTTTFYVDGVQVGNPINYKSTSDIYSIGNRNDGGNNQQFAQQLDNVQIHTRALSSSEISLVAEGRQVDSGLGAYYDFEGTSVTEQLSDKSGNGHNLISTGVDISTY